MTDPSSGSVSVVFITALSTALDANFGAGQTFLVLVVAGSFLGAAGGGVSSDVRGVSLVVRVLIAFVAGIFSSAFELLNLFDFPPAILAALVAFVAVDPKKNLSGLLAIINRLQGIKK